MRTFTITFILLFTLCSATFAQWSTNGNKIYYNGGNVGIGTSGPSTKLHVRGNYNGTYGQFAVQGNSGQHTMAILRAPSSSQVSQIGFSNASNSRAWYVSARWNVDGSSSKPNNRLQWYYNTGSSWVAPLTITTSNKVGIGTENPNETLHLYTNTTSRRAMATFQTWNAKFGTYWKMGAEPGNGHTAGQFMLYRYDNQGNVTIPMTVLVNGQVILGTALKRENVGDPAVRVNGELCVTTTGVCPDYVFEEDYERMSLEELKSYIKENKHLPGVKSAGEIEAQGGVHMVEISYSMLEKIEELTLYTLEQQDELQALKDMLHEQGRQIEQLKQQD